MATEKWVGRAAAGAAQWAANAATAQTGDVARTWAEWAAAGARQAAAWHDYATAAHAAAQEAEYAVRAVARVGPGGGTT